MTIALGPKRGLIINAAFDEVYDTQFRTLLRALDQSTPVFSVLDKTLTAPPGSPANGDAHIVAASPTGAWVGRDGFVAVWTTNNPGTPGGLWEFYEPTDGVLAYNVANDTFYYSLAGVWTALAAGGGGGSSTLAGDTDVVLTSPANNDQLTYETSSSKWKNKPLSFLTGGKFAADIGDGSSTTISVNHGLGTTDIAVAIHDISTGNGEPVTTTYSIVDANHVAITFGVAPLTSAKRVVVISTGSSSTVAGASDVLLTSIADKQILRWETSSSKFKNVDNKLASLLDVILTSIANGDTLAWDSGLSKFKNVVPGGGGGGNPSFVADGDSLTGFTVVGTVAVVGPTTGYAPDQFDKVIRANAGGGSYAFKSSGLSSLAGYAVEFAVAIDGGSGLCDILFGCDALGNGPMIRINTAGVWGIALATAWNAPTTVLEFSAPAATGLQWYRIKVQFNAAGTRAVWMVDGKVMGQVALTLSGDYIGFFGDSGSAGGSLADFRCYKY